MLLPLSMSIRASSPLPAPLPPADLSITWKKIPDLDPLDCVHGLASCCICCYGVGIADADFCVVCCLEVEKKS